MTQGRPISRPLFENPLLVGCEREPLVLVVSFGLMFGMLAWVLHSPVAAAVSAFLFFVAIPLLRRIAKKNPAMFRIYAANLWYRPYYPPRSPAGGRR